MRYLIAALRHPADYRWLALRPFQRHSLVQTFGGLIYLGYALGLASGQATSERLDGLQAVLTDQWLTTQTWAAVWFATGVLALLSSRWPPASKTWGYSTLSALAGCWSAAYAAGVLFLGADTSNLRGAMVWGLVAFLWWAVAGLANRDDLVEILEVELAEQLRKLGHNDDEIIDSVQHNRRRAQNPPDPARHRRKG